MKMGGGEMGHNGEEETESELESRRDGQREHRVCLTRRHFLQK